MPGTCGPSSSYRAVSPALQHSPPSPFSMSSGSGLSAGGRTVISLAMRHVQSKQSQPELELDLSSCYNLAQCSHHDDDRTVARTMHTRGAVTVQPATPCFRAALNAISPTRSPARCEKRERSMVTGSVEPPPPPKTLRMVARARVRRELVLNEDALTFHAGFHQPTALIAGES